LKNTANSQNYDENENEYNLLTKEGLNHISSHQDEMEQERI
jgi:hypothetical protein